VLNLDATLSKAVAEAKAPGAVAMVGDMDRDLYLGASGFAQTLPSSRATTVDTPYDMASLTKVVATTTAIMLLRDAGKLDLDQPVDELVPLPLFSKFKVRHLLTHTAGLPSHKIWYKDLASMDDYISAIGDLNLESVPGTRYVYSDLGFMILGKVVELAGRDTLDQFAKKNIFTPLGMANTSYKPPAEWASHCAATEFCSWRGRVMTGEVHDENAYAMGGVSGHAGLFSTAQDVAKFCRGLMGGKLLKAETLQEMTRLAQCAPYPWQGLGWKLDPWMSSSEGFLPARRAIGHTGWTCTCIWMDTDTGLFTTLLSNTCHPSRTRRYNGTLRGIFYKEVAKQLYAKSCNAHLGVDVMAKNGFDDVAGKRVSILTHSAATDAYARLSLDVLKSSESGALKYVYSPEHGFSGQAEAGAKVSAQASAGAPVISLYGGQKAPSPDELQNVDCLVVDLQDVGARYYTYVGTMKECIAACAKAKKPVLVLDRPNPLGGVVLEGPVAKNTGSLVCWGAAPIRHGMTLGELATWFSLNEFKALKPNVQVVRNENWPSELMHHQCALPWVAPSPNMPTFETALAYVGTCLFEGTNLNEGRGTDAPFLQFGAPWLDPAKVLAALNPADYGGLELGEWVYTPHPIEGKSSDPRHNGAQCKGIRLKITAPENVRAFRTTVAVLGAIVKHQPGQLEFGDNFDLLAGGTWLREQLLAAAPVAEIIGACEMQHQAFNAQRPKLYAGSDGLYS